MAMRNRKWVWILAWMVILGCVAFLPLVGIALADDDDDDDDARARAAVVVTESEGDTRVTEGGSSDSYTIVLSRAPRRNVQVALTSDGETLVEPSSITFTRGNWSAAQAIAVSAVDDDVVEGPHTGVIRHTVSSADGNYDGITVADVLVHITDNDVIRVSISPRELEITEGDAGASYAVSLEGEPAGVVTLRITTDGLTSASPTELRFAPEDWQEPRWVTVTAVADDVEGGTRTSEVRHTLVSDGDVYDAMAVDSVTVTIHDDDRADVVVSSGVPDITERDGSTSFVLRLTSRPTSDVVIPVSASSDRCLLSVNDVRLTRDTWQGGAEVTVSANVGASWYGEETCTIAVGPASSADRSYDGLDPEDVVVTIRVARTLTTLCIPLAVRAWPPLPGTPVLHPVNNPEGWGDYDIAWGSADRAEGYLLQEAGDPGFASPREAYSGPGLGHTVTGHGAGRYFYRVAATNSWGPGPWSDVVAVDVRWEAEPNDDALTQANGPIWPEVTYHGVLEGDDDVQDYYRLEMPSAGRIIEVWLDDIPAGHNYDLVLRDASLRDVDYSGELDNRGEHILTDPLPAGTYYLQVYQRSGGGGPEPYTLRYIVR